MVVSGNVTCDNCSTSLHLRWIVVKEEFRGHHVDLDCPLCGAEAAFHRWLSEGKAKGKTYILLTVEPKERAA